MKKTAALFSAICLSLVGFAQTSFQLGLQVSPNIGWASPNNNSIEADGAKLGFSFGVMGDIQFTENYILSTGIEILNTGGTFIKPDAQTFTNDLGVAVNGFGQTTADIRLNYVQIPLVLKLRTNEIGYMKYFGQIGFGLGINYEAMADEQFTYTTVNNNGATLSNEDVDYADEINLFRAALIVGVGGEYNLTGNTSLVLGLSYNNGITNIFSNDVHLADGNGNAVKPPNPDAGRRGADARTINNMIVLNVGILF